MKYVIMSIIIPILLVIGYIRGVYQFFTSDFEPSYKRKMVYGIGIVTGYNCIVGFFNIHDTPQPKVSVQDQVKWQEVPKEDIGK